MPSRAARACARIRQPARSGTSASNSPAVCGSGSAARARPGWSAAGPAFAQVEGAGQLPPKPGRGSRMSRRRPGNTCRVPRTSSATLFDGTASRSAYVARGCFSAGWPMTGRAWAARERQGVWHAEPERGRRAARAPPPRRRAPAPPRRAARARLPARGAPRPLPLRLRYPQRAADHGAAAHGIDQAERVEHPGAERDRPEPELLVHALLGEGTPSSTMSQLVGIGVPS